MSTVPEEIVSRVRGGGGPMRELTGLERSLLLLTGVRDCAVRVRVDLSGKERVIAYLSAAPSVSREVVDAHLDAIGAATKPDDLVHVLGLPLNSEGSVDELALARLPVLDAGVAERLHTAVSKLYEQDCCEIVPEWSALKSVPLSGNSRAAGSPGCEDARLPTLLPTGPVTADRVRSALVAGPPLHSGKYDGQSIADFLLQAAAAHPSNGVTFVDTDRENVMTYVELRDRAQRIMAGLKAAGVEPGEVVVFQFDRNVDFVPAFWGCAFAGVVPAPLAVAQWSDTHGAGAARLRGTLELLGGPRILTSLELEARVKGLLKAFGLQHLSVLSIETMLDAPTHQAPTVSRGEDVALLLMTSGSTGVPKAVIQTHGALRAAALAIAQQNRFTVNDTCLNWISLEHVGGIVMCHLMFVALGCNQVQVRTDFLLQDPLRWLDLIDRFRASFTWAPNFAFALINQRAEEIAARSWNLTSMRFLVNGGEAVVARTARRFLRLLAVHGLPEDAMRPAWGMSETASAALFSGKFSLTSGSDNEELVEVGFPVPGFEVRIADENDAIVPEGCEGRMQVRGLNVTRGYFNNAVANAESFTSDGWFRTGDLAVIRGGSVTISGREKDVIIVNGVNYHAHEVESAVEEIAGITPTFAAAFAVRMPQAETDELAVAFHPAPGSESALPGLLQRIRSAVTARVGLSPRFILPLAKEQIPKTDIGKIQRTELSRRFVSGKFAHLLQGLEHSPPTAPTVPDWFCRIAWHPHRLREHDPLGADCLLVLAGCESRLVRELERLAKGAGARVVVADAAPSTSLDTALGNRLAHERLVVISPARPPTPAATDGAAAKDAMVAIGAVIALMQSLARHGDRTELLLFDEGVHQIVGEDHPIAARGSVLGLVRTLGAEHPQIRARHVDLGSCDSMIDSSATASRLIAEAGDLGDEAEVAWRGTLRFSRRLVRAEVRNTRVQSGPQTHRGFCLVSGGLGGVGVEICRYLLGKAGSPVLVIGRRSLDAHASAREVFHSLAALGRIRYAAVDVADTDAMQRAVREAAAAFGQPLAGIYHLAGMFEPRLIAEEAPATLGGNLHAKILGGAAMDELLSEHPDAALYAFSSVNGTMGGFAAGAYAAANAYLDALVQQQVARGRVAYALAWSMWDGMGMSGRYGHKDAAIRLGFLPIGLREGLLSLEAATAGEPGHILIGLDLSSPNVRRQLVDDCAVQGFGIIGASAANQAAGQLDPVLDRFGSLVPVHIRERKSKAPGATVKQGESSIHMPVLENAMERAIASVWTEVLHRPAIGRDDNFFDLGGSSLLLAQASQLLGRRLGRETGMRDIYRYPTLRLLAAFYCGSDDELEELDASRSRGRARRARRQQRRGDVP